MNKQKLLILLCVLSVAAALSWGSNQVCAQTRVGFNPNVDYTKPNFAYSPNIRKFVNGLPGLGAAGCTVGNPPGTGTCNENNLGQYIPVAVPDTTTYPDADFYVIDAKQYSLKLHSDLPATTLRGYAQANAAHPVIQNVTQYLGPLILAKAYDPTKPPGVNGNGKPVRVLFENKLPTAAAGNLFLPVDSTVMGAGPGPVAGVNYTQNRASTHLHGGATPWISDGTPHQWITPAGESAVASQPLYQKGASFQNVPDMIGAGKSIPSPVGTDGLGTFYYSNQQSGRLMFYHDHAYGITRLNVYAGMAAPYLLTDQVEEDMISGTNVSGAFTTPKKVLPDLGGVYHYGIPLVIQDKTFVNDGTTPPGPGFPATATATSPTLTVDPRWNSTGATGIWATGFTPPTGGKLWFPHEYMPNENIYDPSGANPMGRWDYGPWLNPAAIPINTTLPSPTIIPEFFADTMMVNGTPFPYVTLPPTAVRFRILNACNDRSLNLQLYVVDPANPTEVRMVPATPNSTYPTWPRDGRNGGVPDPTTAGPSWYQIGNEGGILPQVAVIAPQPVDFEYSRLVPTFGNVTSQSLFIMPAVRADVVVDLSAYAGKTLIVYNDAPGAMPLFDERNDHYTGNPDMRSTGGAPSTPAGFGPNTRTIMQIRVSAAGAAPFDLASLQAALPQAYKATQAPPIVPQAIYNTAFGTANTDKYVNNTDNTVNLTGSAQSVAKVIPLVGGSGYTVAPTVSFISADGAGSGAAGTAQLNGVTAITVTAAGTLYTLPPVVTITPDPLEPSPGTIVTATAVSSISAGGVTAITMVDQGANYTLNPVVTITPAVGDTTGTGALASGLITLNAVSRIALSSGGSGYTKAPFVFLINGNGTGATAAAELTGDTPIGMKNLTEGFDIWYGRMNVLLGTTPVPLDPTAPAPAVPGIAAYIDPPSDIWNDGQTYIFRLAHLGVDSHAIHFHLANLQVINRVDFTNTMMPPDANEVGWKETVRTNPFTDLILAVRPKSMLLPFALPRSSRLLDPTTTLGSTANYVQAAPVPGTPTPAAISNVVTDYDWEYVWHCHLLGHEENDMMRPIVFNPLLMGAPTGSPAPSTTPLPPHWTLGTAVTFTPGAVTPTNGVTYNYRFSLDNGTTKTVVQDYGVGTTWGMPSTEPGGAYILSVDARSTTAAATAPPDATGVLVFDVINPPATGVTATVNVASPHVNGTAITFTASGQGSSGYQYQFSMDGTVARDYSSTATWTMPLSTVAAVHSITINCRTSTLQTTPATLVSPISYTVVEGDDFNADGKPDILWRNPATGVDNVWYMNGATMTGAAAITTVGAPWQIVGVGDFNADNKPDILWRNTATGTNSVWYMNGATMTGAASLSTVDPQWQIVGVSDFNADGTADILWRNPVTGANSVWYMNGATMTGGAAISSVGAPWQIVGVGDFNADGSPDIVWSNTATGENAVWYMNGTTLIGGAPLQTVGAPWQIVGIDDFNADGKPDILWRNPTTGVDSVWYMNGTTFTGAASLQTVAAPWQIVGR